MERHHNTPTEIFLHLQDTLKNATLAVGEALKKRGLRVPKKIGTQGPPDAPIADLTAETEEYAPGDPRYEETKKAEKREEGKVMINSKEAAQQQAARR